jgi:DNA mismatch repair protein MutL
VIAPPRVVRLPQVVADAIAAGEVVERPASVVKELVENALDSGARRVGVSLHGGGLIDIEVSDDGAGIAAGDLELAVARHATSKISATEDLARIRTLGFRGEALASIAAVSDLTLVSREPTSDAARMLRARCGELRAPVPCAAPPGTRVVVSELFATTPARLRFLHSHGAEAAAALRVVTDLALLHSAVAFSCRSDDREQLRTHGGSLRDALRAVYGVRAAELIDVDAPGAIAVSGAISTPQAHRGQRGGLIVGVNGRRVQHRGLQVAVEEAYRGLVPSGRYPHGIVTVEIDSADVDVNVHPTKREVRFREERRVFAAVQRACWVALQGAPLASGAGLAVRGYAAAPPAAPGMTLADAPGATPSIVHEPPGSSADVAVPSLAELAPLRALGQADDSWLVAEAAGALVIVDAHAAHEKAIYEELLQRWHAAGAVDVQLLLIPALIPADPAMLERAERHRDLIAASGFTLDVFGPETLRCTAVPSGGAAVDAERLVVDMLDALGDEGVAVDARRARVAAVVACHTAVRFGDRLDPAAQQQLLDRLVTTPGGMTCPHGRPTVLVLGDAQLRQAFRRPRR